MFFALCSPSALSLTMVHFAWYLTHSDTFKLCEDTPQNRLRNSVAIVKVSEVVFRVFCPMLTICSVTYYGPFGMILDSFRYPPNSVKMLHKTIYKTVEPLCREVNLYFVFFALCSPSAQSLTMVLFAWSWTHLDTFTLCKAAQQNGLWFGWAVVEVSQFLCHVFCLMLTICSVTYSGPFHVILNSFKYLHTLWACSTNLFMKWLSCCRGKWTCLSCCSYAHQLLTALIWTVSHGCGVLHCSWFISGVC